ncbi:MAG: imelysin family protein [Planctomycetota bacterium]|nr:imelysin family protein [Planctomycetota bacterium]
MKHRFPILFVIGLAGCLPGGGGGNGFGLAVNDNFNRQGFLTNVATNLVVPAYTNFAAASATLKTACDDYASAVRNNAPDKAARLTAAQTAWINAMDIWQEAELYQFGPGGTAGIVIGGQNIRDEIYSFPTINACRVDQELVANNFGSAGFITNNLVNVYGLDALENLLFNTTDQNSCSATTAINTDGSWTALVNSGELEQRRADYAAVVATELQARADQLLNAWDPNGLNFSAQLTGAGNGVSLYLSAQQAANEVYFGLFYLELITKDLKVGAPLGVTTPTGVDASQRESRFANRSKQHILNNLRAFQKLYIGNNANEIPRLGFDDFLMNLGANDLANQIRNDTAAAITAFENLPGATLEDDINNNIAQVNAAFNALKTVTDAIKNQLPSVLNFAVPSQGAGDND